MLQSCLTILDPMNCSPPGSSIHGDSPDNSGVGCHAFLHGLFLTQGSNPRLSCLLHWWAGSLPWVPPGKPKISLSEVCLMNCELHELDVQMPSRFRKFSAVISPSALPLSPPVASRGFLHSCLFTLFPPGLDRFEGPVFFFSHSFSTWTVLLLMLWSHFSFQSRCYSAPEFLFLLVKLIFSLYDFPDLLNCLCFVLLIKLPYSVLLIKLP